MFGSDGAYEFDFGKFEVKPFFIAKYQVTYTQYQAFMEADDGFENDAWWEGMPDNYQKQKPSNQRTKIANVPRDRVSWYQSVAFARWMNHKLRGLRIPTPTVGTPFLASEYADGKKTDAQKRVPTDNAWVIGDNAEIRLPTEWEWQWAAMNGSETREYPWEGGWQEGYANTSEAGLNRATAVGMYPHGVAECGALDMAGNLFEWCLNKHDPPEEMQVDDSGDRRVRRGGSFSRLSGNNAAAASRRANDPFNVNFYSGFRLVVCLRPNGVSDL